MTWVGYIGWLLTSGADIGGWSVPGDAGGHHAGVGDGLEGAHLRRQVAGDGARGVGGCHGGEEAGHVGGRGQGRPGEAGRLDEGADEAAGHAGHLLHPPDLPLLLRVGQLDHEAAAGAGHGHGAVELSYCALKENILMIHLE